MNTHNKSSDPKSPPPERFYSNRAFLIWFAMFAVIGMLFFFTDDPRGTTRTLEITEVIEAVEEERLVSGQMENRPSGGKDWYEIKGRLKVFAEDEGRRREVASMEEVPFVAKGRLTEEDFTFLRGHLNQKPASTLFRDVFLTLLPIMLIILVIYFLFVRQMKMAGRGAMSFGKSKAKMLTRDRERSFFKDVAGCDEAKEEVSEIVDFLKDPKRFQKIGGKIPKGVLMVGPPGTGKTLLAKAVAGEADVPFFSISGSDFVEMFVGVGAARVRDMFEQARKNAPCIIFIDEIDAVGRQRGAGLGGGNDEREQTLNSLLVEMDGFDGHEGIIVIAATNREDVLDSALLRPGRFDRKVFVDLPDLQGRAEVLKVHADKVKLSKSVDLETVARGTPGFSGADLANLLNEGALIAARYRKQEVEMEDLHEAREKISFGRERRRMMDTEDKKITAWHEAGHAIIQAVVDDGNLPVHKVTIIPRGQSLGSTMFTPKKDFLNHGRKRLLNQICCAMGGRIAEELVLGDITSGASGDIKMASHIARKMVCEWGMSSLGPLALGEQQDQVFLGREIGRRQTYSEETARAVDAEIRRIIDEQYERATHILKEHRTALDTLAEALIEHETVEGMHVHEILEHGEIRSEVSKRVMPPPEPEVKEAETSGEAEDGEKEDDLDGRQPAGAPA